MPAWGNGAGAGTQFINDMESHAGDFNTLKVNDVNDGDDNKKAAHFINSSTNADARALKIEGASEFAGKATIAIHAGEVALQVTNTEAGDGRALKAIGLSEFKRDDFGPAIKVLEDDGTGAVTFGEIDTGVDIRPRLRIEANEPGNSGARIEALIYEPGTEFHAESTLHLNADPGTFDVIISHEDGGEAAFNEATVRVISPRLTVGNRINPADIQPGQIDGNGTEGPIPIPLDLKLGTRDITSDVYVGNNAHAVIVNAPVRIGGAHLAAARLDGDLDGADPRNIEIGGQGSSNDLILSRTGQITQINSATLDVNSAALIGTTGAAGTIDSGGSAGTPRGLSIGTTNVTSTVLLGRSGQTTQVDSGTLDVNSDALIGTTGAVGKIDSGGSAGTPRGLSIGTTNVTSTVVIGRAGQTTQVDSGTLTVGGTLDLNADAYVGTSAAAGQIDSGGAVGVTTDLKIGTQNVTKDVLVGRSGQTVKAMTDLTVGVAAVVGKVDSNGTGAAPQDIAVGTTNVTANVQLSRAGRTIDMFGQARMNSNAIIMNAVAGIGSANGAGLVYNAAGHGNGISVDFVINNVVVGYFDSTGTH